MIPDFLPSKSKKHSGPTPRDIAMFWRALRSGIEYKGYIINKLDELHTLKSPTSLFKRLKNFFNSLTVML